MRKLRIAQLAPPWLSVPPKKYGGTELIASYLTEGLVKKGHDVTLFASGDSKTKAKLISAFPKALYWEKVNWADTYHPLLHAISCFKKENDFDIIHNHFSYMGLSLSILAKTKVITTYHGDIGAVTRAKNIKFDILKKIKNHPFVSISNSQRRIKGVKLNFVGTIYNGIDVEKFKFSENPKSYVIWMGRITPKKGILEAIEIAKRIGLPLKMAAKIDKNHLPDIEFYEKKVKPLIDGKKVIFLGEIGGYKAKSDFFKNAVALINPIKWNEPFGLVMAEAMACGTPVIVFDKGSANEVVENKKTGFIVKNVSQAINAFKKIGTIKRKSCRERVEKYFSTEKMVDEYEKLYYKILKKK